MPRQRAPYLTSELELVKGKLPHILTMEPNIVSTWVRKEHPDEVSALAEVFNLAASELHHKWQAAVLAQVPVSAWVSGPGKVLHIKPSSAASMRYLSRESLGEDAHDELQQVRTRQKLQEALLEKMSPSCRSSYRPMLHWVEYDKLGELSGVRGFPLSSDTAFGRNLLILEGLMINQLHVYEQDWHQKNKWPENESTPSDVTRAFSQEALQHLGKLVQQWCQDTVSLNSVPESLLALTSTNLSVNRALLEFAAMEARGMEAARMNEQFLRELNQQGVLEVPYMMDDCGPEEREYQLRKILTCWFGHEGSMLQSGSFFRRPMNSSDIEMVVLWSRQLQEMYLRERGGLDGPEAAHKAHGSSCNRFIFAIAMAGAFYCNASTAHEFTGHSNSTYAVFPDRGEAASGNRQTPPTHAAHFLMQAYGQIFFANSGWDLCADRVREYAETASIKRSHLQQLLRFAVKDRTSRELLALYQNLQQLREAIAIALERAKREQLLPA